jgi:phage shock protein PspC (stress-responsive transcriptional regulator)
MKKLYRSRNEKVFAGILGGVGEYADVDPTVLRVVFVVALILTGFFPLAIAYVIAIFLMPVRPSGKKRTNIIDGDA